MDNNQSAKDITDDVGNARPEIEIIAGPCSAESEEQVLSVARTLAAAGVKVLRAGVWKPRTKPGGFEGMGAPALGWLARAKELTGILTATEVAMRSHVLQAVDAGVDILWIGARTSANPFAVQEIADAIAEYQEETRNRLTVLVKNPVNPDLELWIGAIERILGANPGMVGAVHRGFSSFGPNAYRNPPKWRIPIELRRRMPGLPIYCDPSHIGGRRELVGTLSQQALDMGFDGLMIECHPHPEAALSDAAQQLTPEDMLSMLSTLRHRTGEEAGEPLEELRERIDRIDDDLIEVLAKRMRVSREIGRYKERHGMPVVQKERYDALMRQRVDFAERLGLDPAFIRNVLAVIHEESVRQQLPSGIGAARKAGENTEENKYGGK